METTLFFYSLIRSLKRTAKDIALNGVVTCNCYFTIYKAYYFDNLHLKTNNRTNR